MLPLLLASLFFFGSPPLAVSAAQNSSPVATPANAGAAVAVDSTEALYNALLRASAGLAAGAGGGANASVALLAWTASLLRGTGVDQDVINARNSGLGALLVAPTNYAWQQFFDVLERANAKQPAATWPDIFVGYPSVTPAALVAAATSITTPSSASPPNITRTFSNLSAPLSLDALSTEGKAALRGVLLLHLTGAYYLESQLEAMAFPNGSDPAPQHGHIYAVGTNQTIQIHIESDKSLVFRVPANANTPVRDSPYTAYSVTAAATVLPALKDAIADGRLAVQGADHVLVPPTGPANAGGKVFNVNVQAFPFVCSHSYHSPIPVRPSPVRPSPCAHPPCARPPSMRVSFRWQAKEVLVYLLSSDVFLQQVATQPGVPAGITGTEFTGELFTPVPWSPTTRFGMPQELESRNEGKENCIMINQLESRHEGKENCIMIKLLCRDELEKYNEDKDNCIIINVPNQRACQPSCQHFLSALPVTPTLLPQELEKYNEDKDN
ncbi:unnamed protein product [Closterium sp. NIES-64]|nr:unnamed protein product [Closterium sp. NIES-64]